MPLPVSETWTLKNLPWRPLSWPSTTAADIVITPPSGMAWSAFMIRLCITWLICPSSASTAGNLPGIATSHLIFEPLTEKLADSFMMPLKSTALFTGRPPFEKVRSCLVRSFALCAALSASIRGLLILSSLCDRNLATERLPIIAVRRLLKSWAMPPASVPSDSSLLALRSSSSFFFLSAMSRTSSIAALWPCQSVLDAAISTGTRAPAEVLNGTSLLQYWPESRASLSPGQAASSVISLKFFSNSSPGP